MQATASVLQNAVEIAKRWTLFYFITDNHYQSKEQPNCYSRCNGRLTCNMHACEPSCHVKVHACKCCIVFRCDKNAFCASKLWKPHHTMGKSFPSSLITSQKWYCASGLSHTATAIIPRCLDNFGENGTFEREMTCTRNPVESGLSLYFITLFHWHNFLQRFLFLEILSVFFFFLHHEVEWWVGGCSHAALVD